jgi:hypothetical protein
MMHNMAGRRALCAAAAFVSTVVGVVGGAAPPAGAAVRDVSQFACAPGLTTPFTDVGGTTHAEAIACAVHYALTSGTSPTTFSPSAVVSRGQMATFLVHLLFEGQDVGPGEGPPTFTDTAGSPHEASIEVVAELGIAQGTTATTFSPSEPVSRAQMATFLLRTLELIGHEPAGPAPDAFVDDDGSPHESAIDEITALGIAAGVGPGSYAPGGTVSRGAMTSFLVRVLDLGIERGWLRPFTGVTAYAPLDGASEVPGPGDADGRGTAGIGTTDVPGVVCFYLNLNAGAIDAPTAAHVHAGQPGATGDPVVTLPTPTLGEESFGCVHDDDADAIAADPGGYYVNIHTAAFPNGAIRGQLGTLQTEFSADLTPNEVVPGPGEPDALGFVFGFTTSRSDVCVTSVAGVSGTVTGAHLHEGALHANGPEVASFAPDTVDPQGALLECVRSARGGAIAAGPAGFYFDVHTAEHPGGALRGQLVAAPPPPERGPAPLIGRGGTRTSLGRGSA